MVSQGEFSALLRRELHYLSDTDRQALLNEAGVVSRIGAQEALAIKAGMRMLWVKLRLLSTALYNLWTKGIPLEIFKKWHNALATTLDN